MLHNNLSTKCSCSSEAECSLRIIQGCTTGAQITIHRPFYIDSVLIQSRKQLVILFCTACARFLKLAPFIEYLKVFGHFDNAYENCKWRDRATRCFVRDEVAGDDYGASSFSSFSPSYRSFDSKSGKDSTSIVSQIALIFARANVTLLLDSALTTTLKRLCASNLSADYWVPTGHIAMPESHAITPL